MGVWYKEVPRVSRRHSLKTSQSISGARVMTVSYIYTCMLRTVRIKDVIMYYDILLGMNFVSTLWNREVSAIERVLKYIIIALQSGPLRVSTIWRCPLLGGVH